MGKSSWWQFIRAVCIIAVIMIHCPNAIGLQHNNLQFQLYFFLRSTINFPVAIFLFMAGYFTNIEKCSNNMKCYIINRGGHLLIPYLVWSIVYLCVSMAYGEKVTLLTALSRLVRGAAAGHLYYMVVLLQLTLITPLLLKGKKKISRLLWILTPVALIPVYYAAITTGRIPWYLDTIFPLWFGFYWLGIQIRSANPKTKQFLLRIGTLPCLLSAFVINLAESAILLYQRITPSLYLSQNRIGGFIYALVLIGVFYRMSNKKVRCISRNLKWTGDNSYAVYFSHCLVLNTIVRSIVEKYHMLWILKFGLSFIATLIITAFLIEAIKRLFVILKRERWLVYIGF